VHILGVRVDDVTWEEALARIDAFVRSSEPHQVMTPNPEFVMLARRDEQFRALLERVDLAPVDGVGLIWAARLLGEELREIVPGSELIARLGPRAAARGERWFLLGASEGVAEQAGAALRRRYPRLTIAGSYAGSPRPEDDDMICARIEAAKPVDMLFVAYGAPNQDLWIARNQPRLRIPVAIGVGGTLDLLAGRNPRPPALVKRLQLIWLFRLITQPWRWRRQLALVRFVALVLAEAWRRRMLRYAGTRST
jgi:N-acetylglucosaminyldiphosphoundecaprenol N-acetyl-beta-D-mannosaminyltransferase